MCFGNDFTVSSHFAIWGCSLAWVRHKCNFVVCSDWALCAVSQWQWEFARWAFDFPGGLLHTTVEAENTDCKKVTFYFYLKYILNYLLFTFTWVDFLTGKFTRTWVQFQQSNSTCTWVKYFSTLSTSAWYIDSWHHSGDIQTIWWPSISGGRQTGSELISLQGLPASKPNLAHSLMSGCLFTLCLC